MNPVEINEKLLSLINDLGQQNELYSRQYMTYIEKYNQYKLEYAKSYLKNKAEMGKATINEIDAKTTIETAKYKLDADISEGLLKATKEKIEAIKIEIDTLRSILSFQKSELDRVEG